MDTEETVQDIIVDVCKKRITLISNEGETRFVKCESGDQFLAVMEVIKRSAEPEMITYVDPVSQKDD